MISNTTSTVSFCCQKCGHPLKLDPSLLTQPDPQLIQDITAPLYNATQTELEDISTAKIIDYTPNHIKRSIISTGSQNDSDYTLVVTVPQTDGSENLGHRIQIDCKLFDILSSQAEIDHPLCEDCTDMLLNTLDQQLKITEDQCKGYTDFLEKLKDSNSCNDFEHQLKQLQDEEALLVQQLSDQEAESRRLDLELAAESAKYKDLKVEEQEFWKEYNELDRQVIELKDQERSVENQLKYSETQLERLIKMNAFNATFHIWHNGHFGTINGFRLGRLPNIPVEWTEINMAWGQTALLLHSLATKMGLRFQRYRLVPFGNHSYLESLTDKSRELPLYSGGGIRFIWDTKFDSAMIAFLDCLQQFKEEVEKGDSQFCLPYRMTNGKIEETSTGYSYSIKTQLNSEEQWTKALKFMLTNLRWGLAWVSSQFANAD